MKFAELDIDFDREDLGGRLRGGEGLACRFPNASESMAGKRVSRPRGASMDFHLTETYYNVEHIHVLPTILLLVIIVIPFWPIFRKAGFSGALSLLILVPGVNLILLYIVGFSRRGR